MLAEFYSCRKQQPACFSAALNYFLFMETPFNQRHAQALAVELLPNFCDVRVIFMMILVLELLALVLSLAIPSSHEQLWNYLAFISMMLQWLGLINAALLCSARRWLNRQAQHKTLIYSFCLMMLVSLFFSITMLQLKSWMGLDDQTSPLGEHFLIRIMIMSAAIYALVLRFFYIQQQWKLNVNAHAETEIQALRARIRPHFLFNSMNTIASLVRLMPDKAEKAVEDLSDLFRASLHERNSHSLEEELALTRSYLSIEALRLGSRLTVEWDIDNSLKDTEIPALSLQPLAENAIYHGIEPLVGGGCIKISAQRQNQSLLLSVSNPLANAPGKAHRHGNQMAQQNIRRRLKLVYGDEGAFVTNETKTDYTVTLKIPLSNLL
jgi:two-component system sensor histidine kinase AlgZ